MVEQGAVTAVCVLTVILLGGFGFVTYYLSCIHSELLNHRKTAERIAAAKPMKLPGE